MGFTFPFLWSDLLPLRVPGAGGAQGRGGCWCLAGTMRPCSALHTSLVSPVCSLPFFPSVSLPSPPIPPPTRPHLSPQSPGELAVPQGCPTKKKGVCVWEERCELVCLCAYTVHLNYRAALQCWCPYIWCFQGPLDHAMRFVSLSSFSSSLSLLCAAHLKSGIWKDIKTGHFWASNSWEFLTQLSQKKHSNHHCETQDWFAVWHNVKKKNILYTTEHRCCIHT